MKRPRFWLRWFLFFIIGLIFTQYFLLTWLAPRYLVRLLRSQFGDQVTVDRIDISPSLTVRLRGIHVAGPERGAAFSVQSVLIRPRWVWYSTRLLELDSIKIEQPFLQIKRTAAGTLLWPQAHRLMQAPALGPGKPSLLDDWKVSVGSVTLTDGTVEFFDQGPENTFHLLFDHLSSSVGPVALPLTDDRSSFAVRGAAINQKGDGASFYCSGWAGVKSRDVQFSCQTDPFPLATFEPYFQHSPVIRAYSVTLRSASQWSAKANDLDARIQLELGNLVEGDLSVHGRTVIDVRRLAASGERSLSAELDLVGPLNDPGQWEGALIPGNPPVQKLVEELLERQIKVLRISLIGHHIGVRLASATSADMKDIEAAGKEISEALEILSAPLIYQMPADVAPPFTAERSAVIVMPSAQFVLPPKPKEEPAVSPAEPAPAPVPEKSGPEPATEAPKDSQLPPSP